MTATYARLSQKRVNVDARRAEVLVFISAFIAEHRTAPSMRQIAAHLGLTSPSTVEGYIRRHVEEGNLRKVGSGPRASYVPVEVA